MAHQSMLDKTARIVFVSGIPTEVPEEKLKELFSKIGPLLSFKVICDKETGKSRGFAVCEFKDQEIALNAVKTLNNVEIGGRYLKVDHALNEKSRLEMISVMQSAQNVDQNASEKTPETISKAVASLPPEQMFELLKQMKQCVQNNPAEAKNMLLQNPQLSYALLQALVVMRVVDPQIAFSALSNANSTSNSVLNSTPSNLDSSISASSMLNRVSSSISISSPVDLNPFPKTTTVAPLLTTTSRTPANSQPIPPPAPSIPFTVVPPAPVVHDKNVASKSSIPSRTEPSGVKPIPEVYKRDPRLQNQELKASAVPRTTTVVGTPPAPSIAPSAPRIINTATVSSSPTANVKPTSTGNQPDNEKAALIMQVLRLTDAQIAMLPPAQRQSIMLLKEQIVKSAKR